MIALAIIILLRSNRINRQQTLLESEIANARAVQQVILPGANAAVPGFRIETLYEPAGEVGGDFFQILPTSEHGQLVIVGHVAGKGVRRQCSSPFSWVPSEPQPNMATLQPQC
jgi:phosphoserine phosphatase RsbU/P